MNIDPGRLSIRPFDPARASAVSNGGKFKTFMRRFGRAAAAVGRGLLPMIPGGAVISAALGGLSGGASRGSGFGGFGGGGMSPYEMLQLQQEMLQEARLFTVLSNVMKIRHDAAMNAIRNIR